MKKAFTLIELILVIVILGILSFAGINIIKNLYENYLQARSINTLEPQTELVLEQISKRLAVRVKGSTIGRQASTGNFVSTRDPALNVQYNILEWITYSYESFQNGGWSGFVDLDDPATVPNAARNGGNLATHGSTLNSANLDISNLTNGRATLNNNQVGLFFKGRPTNINTDFGFNTATNQANAIAIATQNGNNVLTISNYTSTDIFEQYYLLHTAYAVVPTVSLNPDGTRGTDLDLWLHYNYRPWAGQDYNDNGTSRDLLARNVTRFNFTEDNGVIVIKLCIRDAGRSLGPTRAETTVCKTKAVY